MVIDRGDKTINLCEMKYSDSCFVIRPDYAEWLKERRNIFRQVTGTGKALLLTMITSSGVEHNSGWQTIQNEVELADLFKAEI